MSLGGKDAKLVRRVPLLDGDSDEFKVLPIKSVDAIPFLLCVHYARRVPSIVHAFGLYHGGKLIGVCTFGVPASPTLCEGLAGAENAGRVLELNRLAILPDSPKNSASRLVGGALRLMPRGLWIVSYADTGWGHVGYVYQATDWLYTGMTAERTDMYTGENKHPRHYDKGKLDDRVIRTSKHRYVFVTAKGRMRRKMIAQIRYPIIKEYPKGESRRYDISDPKPKDDRLGKVERRKVA